MIIQNFRVSNPQSGFVQLDMRSVGLIAAIAMVVRLADLFVQSFFGADFLREDASTYWSLAAGIAHSGGNFGTLAGDGALRPETERMPLYSYFLAVLHQLTDGSVTAILMIQSVLDAINCVLIGLLASFWCRAAGLIAGVTAALSPMLFLFANSILTEVLYLFLLTLFLISCVIFTRLRAMPQILAGAFVIGALFGLLTLCRSVLLLTAPFVVLAIAFLTWRAFRDRRPIMRLMQPVLASALAAVTFVAVLSPLLYRNHVQYDSASLSSQSGRHLVYWVLPLIIQQGTGEPYDQIVTGLEDRFRSEVSQSGVDPGALNAFEQSDLLVDFGFRVLAEQELASVVRGWAKGAVVNLLAPGILLHPQVRDLKTASFYNAEGAAFLERVGNYLETASPAYIALVGIGSVLNGLILLAALWGLVLVARRYPAIAVIAVALVIYISLINGPVISPKYRAPLEPVLIALAGVGLAQFWGRSRRRA